jgi:hypothetical protein
MVSKIIQEIKICRVIWRVLLSEMKHHLIESNLTWNDDAVGNEVKVAVFFMVSKVAKKNIKSGTWSDFMAMPERLG